MSGVKTPNAQFQLHKALAKSLLVFRQNKEEQKKSKKKKKKKGKKAGGSEEEETEVETRMAALDLDAEEPTPEPVKVVRQGRANL